MGKIICLANSKKEGERCIAGIDPETGQWIRPVSNRQDGAITWNMRSIDGEEPQILDILKIPYKNYGPDEGFQPENRLLMNEPWEKISSIHSKRLLNYCENDSVILYNESDYIPFKDFKLIPRRNWKSLQLLHCKKVEFYSKNFRNQIKWRAIFTYRRGTRSLDLKVTDLACIARLNTGEKISNDCILTISLATPWKPNNAVEERCYKLIAGVVEL